MMDLIPPKAEMLLAQVLTFGARKYSRIGIDYDLGSADKVFQLCHAGTVEKVIRLKLRVQGNVNHVTSNEKTLNQVWDCVSYAITEDALKLRVQGNAELAMKSDLSKKTLSIEYDSLKIGKNGELEIPRKLLPTPKKDNVIQPQDNVIKILNGITDYDNSTSIKEIMIVFLSQDVRYAVEKTEHHILTTAMTQEDSVDCFAVVATTDWECWETTYKVLKELSIISNHLKPKVISGAWNWSQVDDMERRYLAAAMRHINAFRQGEALDQESGLPHLAHAMCCLAFLIEKSA